VGEYKEFLYPLRRRLQDVAEAPQTLNSSPDFPLYPFGLRTRKGVLLPLQGCPKGHKGRSLKLKNHAQIFSITNSCSMNEMILISPPHLGHFSASTLRPSSVHRLRIPLAAGERDKKLFPAIRTTYSCKPILQVAALYELVN
jgi:hypothetical protein